MVDDFEVARRARDELERVGAHTEVLYAEATVVPPTSWLRLSNSLTTAHEESLSWLESHCSGTRSAPPSFQRLGFDVCSPIPSFHSAILQPGLIPKDEELATQLNSEGLLDAEEVAAEFMATANKANYSLADLISVIEIRTENP